jgi:diguanylate cyclase (GGDEF)-like protein
MEATNNKELVEVLKYCLMLDAEAYRFYNKISASCADDKLRGFWNSMAEEEREHVDFWKKAKELAERDLLPNIFEDLAETKSKFEKVYAKAKGLVNNVKDFSNMPEVLSLAYRLEFYMLTPEFATMFHVFRTLEGVDSMEERYDQHVSEFIAGMLKYGESIPQAEILGETLQNLWMDNKRLAKESSVDLLSGLLNRRGFFNSVNPMAYLAARKKIKIAFLMIDIDDFKAINDTYGHHKGDEVLKFVAAIIEQSIRKSDVAGRYGGEEFIVYADYKDSSSMRTISERIRRNIEEKTEEALGVKVTVSIGSASEFIGSKVEEGIMSVIHKADQNLYRAKAGGKNRVEC